MSRRIKRKNKRREILRELVEQCTEKQQEVFARMYGSVDEINNKEIPWATKQCERTIEMNSPEYKLKKELDKYANKGKYLSMLIKGSIYE